MRQLGHDEMQQRLDELIAGMSRKRLARVLELAEYLSPELAEEERAQRALLAKFRAEPPPMEPVMGMCGCCLPEEDALCRHACTTTFVDGAEICDGCGEVLCGPGAAWPQDATLLLPA